MKFNKVIVFFTISTVLSIITRFFQINYTVDFKNGFFYQEYTGLGYFIIAFIFTFALITVLFSFSSHRRPKSPPSNSVFLGICSFILALSIVFEAFNEFLLTSNNIQTLLFKVFGILAAVYFIALGLKQFIDIPLPNMLSLIPAVYVIFVIVLNFTAISSLALITDNIFLLSAYCIVLLFFINFAKLYNTLETEGNFKKLLATGLSGSLLCFTQSIPHFIINIIHNNSYNHISNISNLSLFAFGLFIITFIFKCFSKQNAE